MQYHSDQEDVHEDAVDLFKRYGDEGARLRSYLARQPGANMLDTRADVALRAPIVRPRVAVVEA